jgi:catechol 2,3-dioxygenase-like lactoylglutathione lyase family enzyme
MNGARTHITGVRTVGIPVTDQDAALTFYVGTLGLEKRLDVPFGEGERWVEVAPAGAATTVALVRRHAGEPIGVDTGVRFASRDVPADHADLGARGVDVDELIPVPVAMFVFRDPDGNRLVIVAGDGR